MGYMAAFPQPLHNEHPPYPCLLFRIFMALYIHRLTIGSSGQLVQQKIKLAPPPPPPLPTHPESLIEEEGFIEPHDVGAAALGQDVNLHHEVI